MIAFVVTAWVWALLGTGAAFALVVGVQALLRVAHVVAARTRAARPFAVSSPSQRHASGTARAA